MLDEVSKVRSLENTRASYWDVWHVGLGVGDGLRACLNYIFHQQCSAAFVVFLFLILVICNTLEDWRWYGGSFRIVSVLLTSTPILNVWMAS